MKKKVFSNNSLNTSKILCPGLIPVVEEYRNEWFKVCNRGSYYTLEHDYHQVVVLPVVEKNNIVMVKVKRPVIDDTPLELPAGNSMPDETPIDAARRELFEETGIFIESLDRFKFIIPVSEMPGRMPVLLNIFQIDLTMDEYLSKTTFDKDEIVAIKLLSTEEIKRKIIKGEIYLSSSVAILSRFILEGTE